MNYKSNFCVLLFAVFALQAFAEDSGFLQTDYELLKPAGAGFSANALVYLAPGATESVGKYDSVIVDYPELFISPDSKYKGMKSDTVSSLSAELRAAVVQGVASQYEVVENPGKNVLYMRFAVTHLYIEKPKRGLMSFTPVGAVASAAKSARSEFIGKNTLVEMKLEAEMLDSTSGEVLFAVVLSTGQRKDKARDLDADPATWDELFAATQGLGARLGCRLNNAHLPEDGRADCLAISLDAGGH